MSNKFSKNKKELAGVKVVSANDVWEKVGNKYRLRQDMSIVGKVEITMSNLILKANNQDRKTGFIDDVAALPARAKNELVNHFYDSKGKRTKATVAYLKRTDKDATNAVKRRK